MKERETFKSTIGIIFATAGSAIGLGNIWRFPYITSENGGAPFLIIFFIIIFFIGIPLLFSELLIGKTLRSNVWGAFRNFKLWKIIGIISILASFTILAFYTTVAGWTMHYMFASLTKDYFNSNYVVYFENFKNNGYVPLLWQIVFIILNSWIIIYGVRKGIERFAKILMPILFFSLFLLLIRALTLENSISGLKFYLQPDLSKVSSKTILYALGQCFFSLSIGMGAMLTYGSYIDKTQNLFKISLATALSDFFIAFLAGLIIFPALFSFNLPPSQGAGLVFITFPIIFEKLPMGNIFGTIFFFLLFIAALTSSISIFEVLISTFIDELNLSRKKSTIILTLIVIVLGAFSTLSWSVFKDVNLNFSSVTETGVKKSFYIFDILDFLASNILLPLGALFIILFSGYVLGKKIIKEELRLRNQKIIFTFIFLIKYFIPIAIIIIFLNCLGIV